MILISHRGNINGPNPKKENNPLYLIEALNKNYSVELDLWYDKGLWLGHDEPLYKIKKEFLIENRHYFFIHVKNSAALEHLINCYQKSLHYFWHQNDEYTITSKGYAWVYPNKKLLVDSICVMPEIGYNGNLKTCYGICSDYIINYK